MFAFCSDVYYLLLLNSFFFFPKKKTSFLLLPSKNVRWKIHHQMSQICRNIRITENTQAGSMSLLLIGASFAVVGITSAAFWFYNNKKNNNMNMENGGCCPPNSLDAVVEAKDLGEMRPLKGKVVEIPREGKESVLMYVTQPSSESVKILGVIMVFHDIFGFASGRTHHVLDDLAEAGFVVFSADYFGSRYYTGNREMMIFLKPWILYSRARMPFNEIEEIFSQTVLPYVRSQYPSLSSKKMASLGFCWGGLPVFRFASKQYNKLFCCGAAPHGSPHIQMLQPWGSMTYGEMVENVNIPLLVLPGWNDPRTFLVSFFFFFFIS